MKRCQYCGTTAQDSALTCAACGASEFSRVCENCGHLFTGAFCPKCGVQVGQMRKICPVCGKAYYSNACPDCGYVAGGYLHTPYVSNQTAQPVKKKKSRTWLWVLGWMCMFPVPLTILMVRNKNLPRWAKILILTLAWLVYLAIGLSESSV